MIFLVHFFRDGHIWCISNVGKERKRSFSQNNVNKDLRSRVCAYWTFPPWEECKTRWSFKQSTAALILLGWLCNEKFWETYFPLSLQAYRYQNCILKQNFFSFPLRDKNQGELVFFFSQGSALNVSTIFQLKKSNSMFSTSPYIHIITNEYSYIVVI